LGSVTSEGEKKPVDNNAEEESEPEEETNSNSLVNTQTIESPSTDYKQPISSKSEVDEAPISGLACPPTPVSEIQEEKLEIRNSPRLDTAHNESTTDSESVPQVLSNEENDKDKDKIEKKEDKSVEVDESWY